MGISHQMGMTDWGNMAKMMAMINPKTATTIHSSRKTITKNRNLVRLLTYLAVYSAMGLALVSHGDDQGPEIMHPTHDDGADEDPDHGRDPSPDDGDGGADYGAGSGYGCIMMSEDDLFPSGNVVGAVLELDGGGYVGRRQVEYLLAYESSVQLVGDNISHERNDHNRQSTHGILLSVIRRNGLLVPDQRSPGLLGRCCLTLLSLSNSLPAR